MLKPLLQLLYPELCVSCGKNLVRSEKLICIGCQADIPLKDDLSNPDNAVSKLFWGRIAVENAAAFCTYDKGGKVQHMMHQLKYKNRPDIGVWFGKRMGKQWLEAMKDQHIDFVIPIPLHPKKLRIRGYNQSRVIADGFVEGYPLTIREDILVRVDFTQTQTRKNRWERYTNVKDMFAVNKPGDIEGKHLLLIDDVITTGATIEACAKKLLMVDGVKISVAGIATPSG